MKRNPAGRIRVHYWNTSPMPADLRLSILKVLAYFDIFRYPLARSEILSFLEQPANENEFSWALEELVRENYVFLHQQFYAISSDKNLACRRTNGNLRAQAMVQKGKKISRMLFQMPYVRAIGISGSLSKNFAAEDADIDYFIIARANRLWIARTLMHLIKKFSFLAGRQHWYCMNYYIDEQALEIEEKNLYTAIELITLVPACGRSSLKTFFRENAWAKGFYPNYCSGLSVADEPERDSLVKHAGEWLLGGWMGDKLDDYFMRITARRWKKKEIRGRITASGKPMSLSIGKHFARPNPVFLQQEILRAYQKRLQALTFQRNEAVH